MSQFQLLLLLTSLVLSPSAVFETLDFVKTSAGLFVLPVDDELLSVSSLAADMARFRDLGDIYKKEQHLKQSINFDHTVKHFSRNEFEKTSCNTQI